jgi:hypothetical protein
MKFVPLTVTVLICEPVATCDGLSDVIDGTGLLGGGGGGGGGGELPPPQLGKVSMIANAINPTDSPRLRGVERPIKHAPIKNTPASESQTVPIFAARSPRRDCPIAVVVIVSVVETH